MLWGNPCEASGLPREGGWGKKAYPLHNPTHIHLRTLHAPPRDDFTPPRRPPLPSLKPSPASCAEPRVPGPPQPQTPLRPCPPPPAFPEADGAGARRGRGRGRRLPAGRRPSHKMALRASAPLPPEMRGGPPGARRSPDPAAGRGERPSLIHSPPAGGAEARSLGSALDCLGRTRHMEGRTPPPAPRAAARARRRALPLRSRGRRRVPPSRRVPARRSRPLFICGFSALQNGAQGGNERPAAPPTARPAPQGGGCARNPRGAAGATAVTATATPPTLATRPLAGPTRLL